MVLELPSGMFYAFLGWRLIPLGSTLLVGFGDRWKKIVFIEKSKSPWSEKRTDLGKNPSPFRFTDSKRRMLGWASTCCTSQRLSHA